MDEMNALGTGDFASELQETVAVIYSIIDIG